MTAPQPEARILGKLLILQQNLELLPALEEQATFIRRTLREIPGLADVGFCLHGRWISFGQNSDAVCFLPEDSGHDPSQAHALQCCAAGGPQAHSIPLRTAAKLYGFMVLTIADMSALAPYVPYLANIANHMALLRERQAMGEELQRTLQGLEQQVEARTAELSMKNALLEREIQQREQAKAALRQSYEVLEQRVRERTAELEASEERLRSIITTAVDGIISIDDQGIIEFFNPAAERLFGYAADEVMGRNVKSLMPMSFRERHDGQMSRRLSTGKKVNFEREVVGRRKDGSTFPLELAVSEMRIGEARKFTGILRDITERKRAEAQVLESEARFRQMADRAPVMIWVTDESRECIYFNEPWLEFTGRPLEQELGSGWAEGVHPEDRDRCLSIYVDAFEARQAFEMEYRLRRHSGEYRWILDRGVPRYAADAKFLGYIGSCIDIDDRKRFEAALREADRRKDEFLAMLGHELRNPLAPIRNAAQILRLRGKHLADFQRPIEIIERQVGHLTQLVDDLLDVSRITRGKIKLQKKPVDLAAVLHRAVEVNQPLIESHRHQLTVIFPPQNLSVEGDEVRLVQVVANLLNNAAKYSEDGGKIELRLEQDGEQATTRVRDTGIGIAPELLPYLFDLFSQGERGLDRAQGGLGIGLALVKSLVEMHGGHVEAHSRGVGQGSEFLIRLPLLAPAAGLAPASGAGRPASEQAGDNLRVLVVDDNSDAAESIAALLVAWGYDAHTAHDGKAALEACQAYRPDAVLLDIGLPGMNGYEVARRLRANGAGYRPSTLIALTGYGQAEDRERALAAGFDHHLVKPMDSDTLLDLLASLRPRPAIGRESRAAGWAPPPASLEWTGTPIPTGSGMAEQSHGNPGENSSLAGRAVPSNPDPTGAPVGLLL